MFDFAHYRSVVFDCDGVILNSNAIKTAAFEEVTKNISFEASQALVKFHITNGGMSRFEKFEYFIESLLPSFVEVSCAGLTVEGLSERFAEIVKNKLFSCEVAGGLAELREKNVGTSWMVASGGAQTELVETFKFLGIYDYFDGGVFGSPATKGNILDDAKKSGSLHFPAVFLGDSKLDHQTAIQHGLDFIFLSDWTEFEDWERYVAEHNIAVYRNIQAMLGDAK